MVTIIIINYLYIYIEFTITISLSADRTFPRYGILPLLTWY